MGSAEEVLDFFDRTGVDDEVALLVLAALDGAESLDAAITGDQRTTPTWRGGDQGWRAEHGVADRRTARRWEM